MRIVGRDKLDEFVGAHADTRPWVENWLAATEQAQWRTPHDIKDAYVSASFLGGNVVIFNVKGNRYRLEVLVAYQTRTVFVRWAGTHAEYTKRTR
jgi:mRNA interferase HigB